MKDDLLARLRDLEDPGVELPVDHAAVLRRGRRRRTVRAASVTALSAAVVAGTVAGASAFRGDGGALPPARSTGVATTASTVLDLRTGEVHTPLDAWLGSSTDRAIMNTAADLYTYRCMKAAGYGGDAVFPGPSAVVPDLNEFGVWNRADVERTGYGSLAGTDPRTVPMLRSDAPAAAVAARRTCLTHATDEGYLLDLAMLPDAPVGSVPPGDTNEGRSVKAAWAACLEAHGVASPKYDEGWLPDGAAALPITDQVRVAGIDLDCKERLGTLQQMADLLIQGQAEYAEGAGYYLRAYRAALEPVLEKDHALLAQAGIHVGP